MTMRRLILTLAVAVAVAAAGSPGAAAFPNGHAAASDLAPVFIPANTAHLSKPAAAAWNTMRLCAVRTGQDLYPAQSQGHPAWTAYRNIGAQVVLWQRYKSGRGALAAFPGSSNHGIGHAVDLALVPMRGWVDRHGAAYGWRKTEAFSEWWHVNYVGGFHRPNPGVSLRFPNLRRGSGGACQAAGVKEVQRRLGRPQDGSYGPATVKAVRRFQRAHHLAVNGRVGSDTWLALRRVTRGVHHDARDVQQLPGQAAPMAGQDVSAVQGLLNARFRELHRTHYLITTSGVLDDATRVAIRRFQRLRHLKVTGRVNDATYAQLLRRLARPQKRLMVSAAGARLVAGFEGYSGHPYRDAVGVWTIGYGHTGPDVFRLSPLSQLGALRLLHRELDHFAVAVLASVRVPLTQGEFDALTSFSYNVGAGALRGSTLLRLLNARHYHAACDQLLRWDRAGGRVLLGLHRRRVAERLVCRS